MDQQDPKDRVEFKESKDPKEWRVLRDRRDRVECKERLGFKD